MTHDEMMTRAKESLSTRSRFGGVLTDRLFGEKLPSRRDLQIYIQHHWYRSKDFYKILTEFALRMPLEHARLLYRNLYEETGAAPGTEPHPLMLRKLVQHLGCIDAFDALPPQQSGLSYLDNRWKAVREYDFAWGLAILFALEYATPETHGRIYKLLTRMQIPAEFCEFHRIHITADEEHAADIETLARALITTEASRQNFLDSLARHMTLSRAYFADILAEMERAE